MLWIKKGERIMSRIHISWASVRDYALVVAGALLEAIALRLFLVPANLASGGISGISQLINHYTGWPIGLMVFIGNLPLFLLGWRYLGGRRFVKRTVVAVAAYAPGAELAVRGGGNGYRLRPGLPCTGNQRRLRYPGAHPEPLARYPNDTELPDD